MSIEIRPATEVTEELVDAVARLVPQLSSTSRPPTVDEVAAIVDAHDSVLFVAHERDAADAADAGDGRGGRIVGMLTLALYRIPTGLKAWIEDVVVDEAGRGKGVGEALNRAALEEARARGAKNVSLTSRPSRQTANRLYERLGFEHYHTNVFRYRLTD